MAYYHKTNNDYKTGGANKIMHQLASEKKKVVFAVCLVAIMAFMWAKLLIGNNVENSQAEQKVAGQTNEKENIDSTKKNKFIELPVVEGRNDVLKRDFFTFQNKDLDEQNKQNVEIVKKQEDEEIIEKITKKMRLDAITMGSRPVAFINDKLLGVGDILTVTDGLGKYECEITEIKQTEVKIKCGQEQAILKLAQIDMVLENNEN